MCDLINNMQYDIFHFKYNTRTSNITLYYLRYIYIKSNKKKLIIKLNISITNVKETLATITVSSPNILPTYHGIEFY